MPCTDIPSPDFRQKYRNLKRKLKILIYENECFQEELKKAQRKYLRVSRDKSFLLERLLQYEPVEETTSDSEATVSSDSEAELKVEMLALKKKKTTPSTENAEGPSNVPGASSTPSDAKKKKSRKLPPAKPVNQQGLPPNVLIDTVSVSHGDGHMTSEEIERHLESKQALRDLMPEKTPLTVPVDIFSNDPSGAECDINGQVTASSPNVAEGVSEDDGLIIDLHE